MEPDQRHADLIVQEMGMKDAKPVSTPGEKSEKDGDEGGEDLDDITVGLPPDTAAT